MDNPGGRVPNFTRSGFLLHIVFASTSGHTEYVVDALIDSLKDIVRVGDRGNDGRDNAAARVLRLPRISSLIKGGHASYQLDVSNERVRSTEMKVNVLVALNHHGLELNMEELKEGGIVLHVTPGWQFPERHQKLIKERSLRVLYFPIDDILTRLGRNPSGRCKGSGDSPGAWGRRHVNGV